MPPYPGFIGGTAIAQSPEFQNERTVNFYVDRGTGGSKTDGVLYPRPGFSVFAAASGPSAPPGAPNVARGRAIFEENGRCFAVIGNAFLEISSDGTITEHARIADDDKPAYIASNGDAGGDLIITSGGTVYRFILASDTFSTIPDVTAQQCDSLDGSVFALDRDTSTVWSTLAFDGSSFPAYKQRDSRPDPWQAIRVLDTLVYLFGERSTDIYYNAGSSPFPLEQQTAGAFPYGIAAPDSLAIVGGSLAWLGRSASGVGMVMAARGANVQEISTPALRWVIDGYRRTSRIDDAVGAAWEYMGHQFYVLTFPSADATWVFDLSTGLWVEFLTWESATGRYTAFRPHWTAVAFGEQLFADRVTGEIHRLDPTSMLDVTGSPVRRLRRPPALFNEQNRFRLNSLDLILDVGLTGGDSTPEVALNYSRDGGKTWSQASTPQSVGLPGEYRTTVSFRRLGVSRTFTPEIVCSDNYPYRISGAFVDVTPGAR